MDSEPAWAKQLGGELDVGLHTIVFRVRSPVSDLTASCNFTIEVFGKFILRLILVFFLFERLTRS